jgi:hypothetical protein
MATGDKDIDLPVDQSVAAEDIPCTQESDRGFLGRVSSASKLAGDYLSTASAGVAKVSRDAKDLAITQAEKASDMVSDAYQSAISTKDVLKNKAVESGKDALAGAGVSIVSSLAVKGLKKAASTKGLEIFKPLGKGNVAVNLVDASITIGQQGYKLYKGEVTKSEMAHACAEKGSGMLATAGGAGLGAMAAAALALPTGGASLVIGGVSMLAGAAAPKVYQAGRKLVADMVDKRTGKSQGTVVEATDLQEAPVEGDTA